MAGLRRFFALQLRRNYLPRGLVFVVRAGQEGAAMWLPPARDDPARVDLGTSVALATVLGMRLFAMRRLALALAAYRPTEPHWYLGTIGIEPRRQRQGLGTALLTPVLERCDAEREIAYLECSRAENLAFYARLGFRVTDQVAVAFGGPTLWLMVRPPAPSL